MVRVVLVFLNGDPLVAGDFAQRFVDGLRHSCQFRWRGCDAEPG